MFKEATEKIYTVNVDIGLFGIRNLIFPAEKPRVYIKLTNDSDGYRELEICDSFFSGLPSGASMTHCPNFGQIIRIPDI
jgi:hypothetical protein